MTERPDHPYGGPPPAPTRVSEETLRDWEASYDSAKLAAAAEIRRLRAILIGFYTGERDALDQLRDEAKASMGDRKPPR